MSIVQDAFLKLDVLAVLTGLGVFFGIATVVALVIGVSEVVADMRRMDHRPGRPLQEDWPEEEVERRVMARLHGDGPFQVGMLVMSLLALALAAALTACHSDAAPRYNALVMAFVVLAVSWWLDAPEVQPRWSMWSWTLLALPAALLGAALCA